MRKRKKNGFFRTVLAAMVCMALIVGGIRLFGSPQGESGQTVTVRIPQGATGTDVAQLLGEWGVVKSPLLYKLAARFYGASYQPGIYDLTIGDSYAEIIQTLNGAPNSASYVRVLIPEGFEARQIADRLAENGIVSREAFEQAINSTDYDFDFLSSITDKGKRTYALEGYLFPDTYEFERGMMAEEVVKVFLTRFEQVFSAVCDQTRLDELGMTADEVVTLASIIEREALSDADRGLVSGVFHNRLKRTDYMNRLQSCATVQYILKERKPVLSTEDTQIKSPYNTYLNPGLPVGPIANPGRASLSAALHPEQTDCLYFGLAASGRHVFSRTYEEHLAAMAQ